MRFTFVAALGLVASVFATPLAKPIDAHPEKRQLESQASVIETLRQEVISQTTIINASLADASEDPGQAEVSALRGVINPALEAITAAIGSATSNVNRGRRLQRQEDGEEEESCDAQCLTERVLEVVYEIVSTVRAVIERIGLGPVLLRVNPLLLALSALVLALNVLVTGLLVTVTAVVTTVLGGLGLGLLLLGWG